MKSDLSMNDDNGASRRRTSKASLRRRCNNHSSNREHGAEKSQKIDKNVKLCKHPKIYF